MKKISQFILKWDNLFLSFITVLFIIRMAIPFTIYLFITAFFIYSLSFAVFRTNEFKNSGPFIQRFWKYLVLLLFYVFGLVLTKTISYTLIKEIPNAIALFVLAFYWYTANYKNKSWKEYRETFLHIFAGFSVFASIAGIAKFSFHLIGINFKFLDYPLWSQTSSLVSDNNFYSLAILIGIVIILKLMIKEQKFLYRFLLQLAFFFSSIAVFLSSSRRGIIILIIILGILFFTALIYLFYKKSVSIKNIVRNTLPVTISSFTFLFITLFSILFTSAHLKSKIIKRYDIDNTVIRFGINSAIMDYGSIIKSNLKYNEIDDFIWRTDYDKQINGKYNTLNPSVFFKRASNIVFPLKNQPKSIPLEASGILVSQVTESSISFDKKGMPLAYTNINSASFSLKKDNIFYASIYCYVSDSCNLDYAELRNISTSWTLSPYNMLKKGTWQKLNIQYKAVKDTSLFITLFIGKYNEKDFTNIKGYVLFAFPEFKYNLDNLEKNFESSVNYEENLNPYKGPLHFVYKIRNYFDQLGKKHDLNYAEQLVNKGKYLEASKKIYNILWQEPDNIDAKKLLELCFLKPEFKLQNEKYWNKIDSTYNKSQINNVNGLSKPENILIQKQVLSVSKHKQLGDIIETSIYPNDKIKNEHDTILVEKFAGEMDRLYGARTERWKYAFYMFKNEFNFLQKIIGNGFNYQFKFGERFKGKKIVDYPHNVILSAFLYSGILGGVYYIYFLISILLIYWKNIKKEPVLFIAAIISLFYSMSSSNSHFDSTLLAVLCIFPFIFSYNKSTVSIANKY